MEENAAFLAWYKQDLLDWAELYGVSLRYHPNYPLRPARALRAALRAAELKQAPAFALAVFRAYWSESRDISDLDVLGEIASACGLDPAVIRSAATDKGYAKKLEVNNREAIERGLFGVPSVVCRGKLFFGNDRLGMLDGWLGGEGPAVFAEPPRSGLQLLEGRADGERYADAHQHLEVLLHILRHTLPVEFRILGVGRGEADMGQHGLDEQSVLSGVAAGGAQLLDGLIDIEMKSGIEEGGHLLIVAQAIEDERPVFGIASRGGQQGVEALGIDLIGPRRDRRRGE
jgi:hypothetical protein